MPEVSLDELLGVAPPEHLKAFAFAGYRSFASGQPAVMGRLSNVNLIVGQNNVGKSNVLRVLMDTFGASAAEATPLDRPVVDSVHRFDRWTLVELDPLVDKVLGPSSPQLQEQLRSFLRRTPGPEATDSGIWIPISRHGSVLRGPLQTMALQLLDAPELDELQFALTNSSGGEPEQKVRVVLHQILKRVEVNPPRAHMIDGNRAISDDNEDDPDLNGRSIKRRLQQLQQPTVEHLEDRDRFAQIQRFVRTVLDDDTVVIDVPYDLSTILVTQQGHTLPIEHCGTGVHEVVILAAAATIIDNDIVCIEEPEVHLHPLLQKKLLHYLRTETTNQYFIATHSAHLLDSAIGEIFHVTRLDGRSHLQHVGSAEEQATVCMDLGYRPSDLVQTNAVVWVEGPSDRLYLRHWIDLASGGSLLEGVHYSIMFYGGSLLNALSSRDLDDIDDFISLRRLNRHVIVLMDSDRTKQGQRLNSHKRRVIEDLGSTPGTGLAWVTKGYTVENYVPHELLEVAVTSVHPTSTPKQAGLFENPLSEDLTGIRSPKKTAIARAVVTQWPEGLWPLDLKNKLAQILLVIEHANRTS